MENRYHKELGHGKRQENDWLNERSIDRVLLCVLNNHHCGNRAAVAEQATRHKEIVCC